MHVEKIKYIDFNGQEREEEFLFNLTKQEVIEMEVSAEGGVTEMIKRIVAAKDYKSIVAVLKDFILRSYGVKSADGRRFMKSDEIRDSFAQTEAFSALYMKLAFDADATAKFVNEVVPANIGDSLPASIKE